MTIHVVCEHCGREYRVKDAMAGRRTRCKECGETLVIPQPDDEFEPYEDDEYEPSDAEPSRGATVASTESSAQAGSAKSKWTWETLIGRGKAVWSLWGVFAMLCLLGWFFPGVIKFVMYLWTCAALGAIAVGLVWLAANCFRASPVDALLMVLLPFVGFAFASSSIDLMNERNERPFRMTWRGLWSFIAGFTAAVVFTAIADRRPDVPARPQRPSFMTRTAREGASSGSGSPPASRPTNPQPHHRSQSPRRSATSSYQPDSYPVSVLYDTLGGPADEIQPRLEQAFLEIEAYVPGSLKIDESKKQLHFQLTTRPAPDVVRPFVKAKNNVLDKDRKPENSETQEE